MAAIAVSPTDDNPAIRQPAVDRPSGLTGPVQQSLVFYEKAEVGEAIPVWPPGGEMVHLPQSQ